MRSLVHLVVCSHDFVWVFRATGLGGGAERTRESTYPGLSSYYKDTGSIRLGPTLAIPFNHYYLLVGPNIVTQALGIQLKTFMGT